MIRAKRADLHQPRFGLQKAWPHRPRVAGRHLAIRIDPSQSEFFDNRGLHLAANGDYVGAIADYDEAIKIDSQPKFLTNRGNAYQARKDYERAIADYDAALKLDPKFQRAYKTAARPQHGKGDRARALQDYAEAVRLDPSDKTAASNHQEMRQRWNGWVR